MQLGRGGSPVCEKVRQRKKIGKSAADSACTVSGGKLLIPGLLRERLFPFLWGIWRTIFVLSRDSGAAREPLRGAQQWGQRGMQREV